MWGSNDKGELGQNNVTLYSSPVQIPGTTWDIVCCGSNNAMASKTDGTMWMWGDNEHGQLGQNQPESTQYSSPVQVPGSWSSFGFNTSKKTSFAIK
jgi:alpha-tubulin suppressor-like RCC1 family protein